MRDAEEWGGSGRWIYLLSAVACAGLMLVLRGPHPITLPRGIGRIKAHTSRLGLLPGRAHFPQWGFIEFSVAGADPRAKGEAHSLHPLEGTPASRGAVGTYPVGVTLPGIRESAYEELRAGQGLRGTVYQPLDGGRTTGCSASSDWVSHVWEATTRRRRAGPTTAGCCEVDAEKATAGGREWHSKSRERIQNATL